MRSPFRLSFCVVFALLSALLAKPAAAQTNTHLFLTRPSISRSQIVFEYGNNLWIVDRKGGEARRLTTGPGRQGGAHFSPDGTQIAFTGEEEGNADVYVMPAGGGEPRRLTYHPGPDFAIGWTPDGKRVLLNSHRDSFADSAQLYTIAADGSANGGTLPQVLPLPMAEDGSYSADGSHIAYQPIFHWQEAWKRYHGGQTLKIWLANLSDSGTVAIPRENSNDFNPMWVRDTVYFLSDRSGNISLWSYNVNSKKVTEVVKNNGLDFKAASATSDAIAYEQFGVIYLFELKSGKSHRVNISVAADLTDVRPHFQKINSRMIENSDISPTGQRAVFEAHGDLLTVPATHGDIRDITATTATAERDPAWSPDGKSIAYFSDESGEYALHIRPQDGIGPVKKISLGNPSSFFYSPIWSADSKQIAFTDKRLNLWCVDVEKGTPLKVDTDLYDSPAYDFHPRWSPDGKWLTYAKQLHNHLHALFLYSLASSKSTQVTDGLSDAYAPVFDKSGKYLYFLASTNVGLSSGWIDMTSIGRPVTSAVYVVVLRKDLPSPLVPLSDDENKDADKDTDKKSGDKSKPNAAGDKAKEPKAADVRVDFENIDQRILAVPIPEKNFFDVTPGKEGVIYVQERPIVSLNSGPPQIIVNKFDFKTRKIDPVVGGVSTFVLSANGEKMLYRLGQQWFIAGTAAPAKPGEGALKMADMEVFTDPRAEWKQMYRETWRIERDFFYDPHLHGLDLKAAEAFYAPWLDNLSSRADLTDLFTEMLGNINVGHMFIRNGPPSGPPPIKVGLLGADYTIENNRYRFTNVFNGENWNPELQAPLTQPGINARAGEYLLAVQGRELHGSDNIYSFFLETAGKQIVVRIGPNADGSGARDVTVVPVDNEFQLRHLAWVENNRRKVDQLSQGKLAYVHLPDTAMGGYKSFNRYFFAETEKQGAVIDERYNHGGDIADYVIEYLGRRHPMGMIATREGADITDPSQAIYGPKVMIINQFAGSGGDAMPWYFRKAKIGPLVGTRTWGGLVGIGGYPVLMDGGTVTAPRWAFYGLGGEWEVENHGIAPDVEVDQDPKLVREGHDPQLERAVAVALEELKANPPQKYKRPAYPNYHPTFPAPTQ